MMKASARKKRVHNSGTCGNCLFHLEMLIIMPLHLAQKGFHKQNKDRVDDNNDGGSNVNQHTN